VTYQPVDLADKLASFSEHWSPKVIARLNDYEVKLAKLQGEFVWHSHGRHRRAVPGAERQAHHPAPGR
jgi:hypothetical protein